MTADQLTLLGEPVVAAEPIPAAGAARVPQSETQQPAGQLEDSWDGTLPVPYGVIPF